MTKFEGNPSSFVMAAKAATQATLQALDDGCLGGRLRGHDESEGGSSWHFIQQSISPADHHELDPVQRP